MNIEEHLYDVSPEDIRSFGGMDQRKLEFSKTGTIGKQIRSFPIAYKHNRVLFVHGGISYAHAQMTSIYRSHYNISDPLQALNARAADLISREKWTDEIFGYDLRAGLVQGQYKFSAGPLWFRGYANRAYMANETKTCLDLQKSLHVFGADIMVIGHVSLFLTFIHLHIP
jgi:hypothetical protein